MHNVDNAALTDVERLITGWDRKAGPEPMSGKRRSNVDKTVRRWCTVDGLFVVGRPRHRAACSRHFCTKLINPAPTNVIRKCKTDDTFLSGNVQFL